MEKVPLLPHSNKSLFAFTSIGVHVELYLKEELYHLKIYEPCSRPGSGGTHL